MFKRIKNLLFKIRYFRYLAINETVNQKNLIYNMSHDNITNAKLFDYGFSTFSQHEEDGMLLYIFSLIGSTNKKCVEMCIGTGVESNTANLIVNHFWTGLLFDGDLNNIDIAKKFYSRHKNTQIYFTLVSIVGYKTVYILFVNPCMHDFWWIDLFSLDIDGIDYYLLESLDVISPRVIVLEINHLWGYEKSYTVPYDKNFTADFSLDGSDYAGASLSAFIKLTKKKGYRFIGTNRFATNAFFIRNDIEHDRLNEVTDLSIYFEHPRVVYGMTERFNRIKDKKWVEIK